MDNAAAKGVPWKYAQPIYDPYSRVIVDPYGSKSIQEHHSPTGRSASWRRSGSRRLGVHVLARPDAPSPGARSAVGGGRAGRCQPDEARITFDVGDDEDDDGVVCAGDFLLALASFQGHVAVVEEHCC
jgi:hypothetical protein